jgi:hypothetical protein
MHRARSQINDEMILRLQQGFKSVSYITATSSTPPPFNPEFVDAYGIGLKSDLFESRCA